jgi:hypothetical protein
LDADNYIDSPEMYSRRTQSVRGSRHVALKTLAFSMTCFEPDNPAPWRRLEADLSGKGTFKDPRAELRIRGSQVKYRASPFKVWIFSRIFKIESRTFRTAELT